jgi:hypothetical protein
MSKKVPIIKQSIQTVGHDIINSTSPTTDPSKAKVGSKVSTHQSDPPVRD